MLLDKQLSIAELQNQVERREVAMFLLFLLALCVI
jgi:hypothetical protein